MYTRYINVNIIHIFFWEGTEAGCWDDRGVCLCIPADKMSTESEENIMLLDNQQRRTFCFLN